MCVGAEVLLQTILTSTSDKGDEINFTPKLLSPGRETQMHCDRNLCESQSKNGLCRDEKYRRFGELNHDCLVIYPIA
jgi:hypothetical protein